VAACCVQLHREPGVQACCGYACPSCHWTSLKSLPSVTIDAVEPSIYLRMLMLMQIQSVLTTGPESAVLSGLAGALQLPLAEVTPSLLEWRPLHDHIRYACCFICSSLCSICLCPLRCSAVHVQITAIQLLGNACVALYGDDDAMLTDARADNPTSFLQRACVPAGAGPGCGRRSRRRGHVNVGPAATRGAV
jgi:hypothetical protein